MLEVIAKSNKTLSQLKSEMEKFPQVLINIQTKKGLDLSTNKDLINLQQEVEKELGDDGRVLIRASGTEPVVRVMVEGKDLSLVQMSATKLAKIIS